MANQKKKGESLETLYIGSRSGGDRKMVEEAGLRFQGVFCGKLRRYFSWENFLDFFKIPIGTLQALTIILRFRPDVIFSKGGFVSVPAVIAGWILRKRIILHESDVVPGLANRLMANLASEICVSFKESVKYFKNKKVYITGNPVRSDILDGNKKKGLKLAELNDKLPIILVMGGSQGAQQLNKLVWKNLKKLLPICQIIHICGRGKAGVALKSLQLQGYKQFGFVKEDLKHLYAACDLVVMRSGANSLAEIALLQKPSVLVPLPLSASRGDQIHNARIFVKKGVSIMVDSDQITADDFGDILVETLQNDQKLANMQEAFKDWELGDSLEKITNIIKENN